MTQRNLTGPLTFEPLFMERVWGGRRLETLFGRRLPPAARIGESWEIVDRPEAQSVVHLGPLRGRTLHDLWTKHRRDIFGKNIPDSERFPLLLKLIDADAKLSLQVHPPPSVATALGSEAKSEFWLIAAAAPDAEIYAGLRAGVSRKQFEDALASGAAADCVHRLRVKAGDAIFMPSGRLHAIGAGNVIVEIQQNSDTTYRVFDWNRTGLDGKPRKLHIDESLQSIDFEDVEPALLHPEEESLVDDSLFRIERWRLDSERDAIPPGEFAIFFCVSGEVECSGLRAKIGEFFLIPASLTDRKLKPLTQSTVLLRTTVTPL
jgi:mannose-6-phosphate isomerase